jgi:hypothetical protein
MEDGAPSAAPASTIARRRRRGERRERATAGRDAAAESVPAEHERDREGQTSERRATVSSPA